VIEEGIMSETNELRGWPQVLANERMALLEAAQCANALLDDHLLAQRATAMAGLSRRRVAELRAMYVTPDSKEARPERAEESRKPLPTSGDGRRWQPSGVFFVLVCVVALASMSVLVPD
jgi:hypothetical protein